MPVRILLRRFSPMTASASAIRVMARRIAFADRDPGPLWVVGEAATAAADTAGPGQFRDQPVTFSASLRRAPGVVPRLQFAGLRAQLGQAVPVLPDSLPIRRPRHRVTRTAPRARLDVRRRGHRAQRSANGRWSPSLAATDGDGEGGVVPPPTSGTTSTSPSARSACCGGPVPGARPSWPATWAGRSCRAT
jgi:hypothetical protein